MREKEEKAMLETKQQEEEKKAMQEAEEAREQVRFRAFSLYVCVCVMYVYCLWKSTPNVHSTIGVWGCQYL